VELSLVIPVYDEVGALPGLWDEIVAACDALDREWEAIFVDDGSTDGSTDWLAELATLNPHVTLVKLRRNFGKSAALRAGFARTRGDVVVTLDADGQDDPAEIGPLVAKVEDEGYGLVSGWKRSRQDPAGKRYASGLFNGVTRRFSGLDLHDFNCGLKAYNGDCARSLELYGELHRYIPLIVFQRGWPVSELPVNHRPRMHGRSKFGAERYGRGLLDLFTVVFLGRYQHRPLHLFGGAGLAAIAVGFVICVYLTIVKIGGEAIGRRPLLLLGVLLIVVGVQLLTLGLLGEMVAATRQDVRGTRGGEQLVERVVGEDGSQRTS
jgi:glycosyltransferase involved in cell wall biosynthesis